MATMATRSMPPPRTKKRAAQKAPRHASGGLGGGGSEEEVEAEKEKDGDGASLEPTIILNGPRATVILPLGGSSLVGAVTTVGSAGGVEATGEANDAAATAPVEEDKSPAAVARRQFDHLVAVVRKLPGVNLKATDLRSESKGSSVGTCTSADGNADGSTKIGTIFVEMRRTAPTTASAPEVAEGNTDGGGKTEAAEAAENSPVILSFSLDVSLQKAAALAPPSSSTSSSSSSSLLSSAVRIDFTRRFGDGFQMFGIVHNVARALAAQ